MKFSQKLIAWYQKNKRELPWRNTQNPYYIWISEIILQQTRVNQGLPYYLKFVDQYPTLKELALAKEEEVLKLWQGLGYYTRARNLHYTAKMILEKHSGKFPGSYDEILNLKGIGKYTAAAISSFAYNLPYPVVDGNVQRVLARIFGVSDSVNSQVAEKKFYALAGELIDKKNPGTFNQAIMEFGALHCTPSNPDCKSCIFKMECIAGKTGRVSDFPVPADKTKQRNRYFNYLVIHQGANVFLNRRSKNDIWKNLYEFPLIESERPLNLQKLKGTEGFKNIFGKANFSAVSNSTVFIHNLSHQKIHAFFFNIILHKGVGKNKIMKSFLEVKKTEIKKYAVPRLIEKYLEEKG